MSDPNGWDWPAPSGFWDSINREEGWIGCYDRQGKPITYRQWGKMHSDQVYKRVAETTIGDWWVSTVWLGMDHGFGFIEGDDRRPIIFETMPFYRNEPSDAHPALRDMDQEMWRYHTEAEAIAGHDQVCAHIRTLIADAETADEVMAEAIEAAKQPEEPDA